MRTRKEAQEVLQVIRNRADKGKIDTASLYLQNEVLIEVMLDIRELLSQEKLDEPYIDSNPVKMRREIFKITPVSEKKTCCAEFPCHH